MTKQQKSLLERWDRVAIKGKEHGMPQLPECILLIDGRLLFECPSMNKARVPMYILPHIEKWLRNDVAVWFQNLNVENHFEPAHITNLGTYSWYVNERGGSDYAEETPAAIDAAEALCECLEVG